MSYVPKRLQKLDLSAALEVLVNFDVHHVRGAKLVSKNKAKRGFGYMSDAKSNIYIDGDRSPYQRAATAAHEIIHVWNLLYNVQDSEPYTEVLEAETMKAYRKEVGIRESRTTRRLPRLCLSALLETLAEYELLHVEGAEFAVEKDMKRGNGYVDHGCMKIAIDGDRSTTKKVRAVAGQVARAWHAMNDIRVTRNYIKQIEDKALREYHQGMRSRRFSVMRKRLKRRGTTQG